MKISKLLASRQSILRQAYLANLASAYATLQRLAIRISAARLRGPAQLRPAEPREERYCASLTALAASQSVIEEHFTDEDILELADAIVLAIGAEFSELEFEFENFEEQFLTPLRAALDQAGVVLDLDRNEPNLAAGTQE